ncbi:hypothetical protein BCR33DRAFT_719343 [Rhizoclosmatium globosum]|uniref:Transmembrane protein n=1 Tax=Rhizoclosmatium globosum TaxID=329046 RepID=A0A1Y2C1R0_9FUNG|nr:hypothetical protein BCR33DRAFT_719343 [Rhizoclosmatium globosum]|eukprot:ORY40834.1 hypothetical protein BCR33DRAFT_719343 [Rhizoclosmatium globosum]
MLMQVPFEVYTCLSSACFVAALVVFVSVWTDVSELRRKAQWADCDGDGEEGTEDVLGKVRLVADLEHKA